MGRHGYMSEIKALALMNFLMGCIFGCGIGQVLSVFGEPPGWVGRGLWVQALGAASDTRTLARAH